MKQNHLFSVPISRNTDPQTSKDAEDRQNLGPRAKRAREVLRLIYQNPNCTAGELARIYVRHYPQRPINAAAATPHKRIPDLIQKDLVARTGKRRCGDTGYEAHTYLVTDRGRRELRVKDSTTGFDA
jgi:predicted HTH transcriptional regulator